MKLDNVFNKLEILNNKNDKGHNMSHINEVYSMSLLLNKNNDKNLEIDKNLIKLTVYGHDCMSWKDRKNHHILSSEYIKSLTELNNFFEKKEIEMCCRAIYTHKTKLTPESLLGNILYVADKLPSLLNIENMIERSLYYNVKNSETSLSKDELLNITFNYLNNNVYGRILIEDKLKLNNEIIIMIDKTLENLKDLKKYRYYFDNVYTKICKMSQ